MRILERLVKDQTKRSKEQNRLRNRPTEIQTINLQQMSKGNTVEHIKKKRKEERSKITVIQAQGNRIKAVIKIRAEIKEIINKKTLEKYQQTKNLKNQ